MRVPAWLFDTLLRWSHAISVVTKKDLKGGADVICRKREHEGDEGNLKAERK